MTCPRRFCTFLTALNSTWPDAYNVLSSPQSYCQKKKTTAQFCLTSLLVLPLSFRPSRSA